MVHQLPTGARDLLPLDVAQRSWIEARLRQVFESWGYHEIITPTLERLETLVAGDAVQGATVIQFQDTDDTVLGLRPELTASIARATATRLSSTPFPHRLFYSANVFRRPQVGTPTRQHEFFQAGVELLGCASVMADAEIVVLLADCLQALGLSPSQLSPSQGVGEGISEKKTGSTMPGWTLILGDAGLTRSLLGVFPNDEPLFLRHQVRQAIAHLDRVALETLPLSAELRERALGLFDLRGTAADVLVRLQGLHLDTVQVEAVHRLKQLVELLEERAIAHLWPDHLPIPLLLDLSLLQTFDYYTGIVFKVASTRETGQRVLGQGGRYDQLLGRYHPERQSRPGIGFSLNLEDLQAVLLEGDRLPCRLPQRRWLVVPWTPDARANAFVQAQKLRQEGEERVELYLEEPPDTAYAYAKSEGMETVVRCFADGSCTQEPLTGSP